MKARFVSIALAGFCLCACSPSLSILHVNDTHSHLEPQRTVDRNGHGGVIERAAIVDSVRQSRGEDNVLLLHAGDFNQGSSYFTVFGGELEVKMVNDFAYDCITLGNHEFDNGIEDLAARLAKIDCPVVSANLRVEDTPLQPYVQPYAIVEKAGRKIGIIGLVPNLKSNVSYSISSRLFQYKNDEVVNKWAKYLKKSEKCDLVILLSHLGYGDDLALVKKIRNVDIVIGGHSHTFVDDFKYVRDASGRRVPVITDGCFGLDVGEVIVK